MSKLATKMSRGGVLFAALLTLGGCTREEATARLRSDLQVDSVEIIHARFPCRSPDIHLFGYRFRIGLREGEGEPAFGLRGEHAYGDICWNLSAREWSWQILPKYPLSRLNIRK